MKKVEDYNENQRLIFALYELEFFISEVNNDRKAYIKYNEGQLKNASKEKIREMEVLTLLEKLGYPMNEMGTYLYKNMIIKIINELEQQQNLDCKYLISQLKNGYSQFYLDLSRNDLDIGIKTFHRYIEIAMEKVDYSKADLSLLYKIFGNVYDEIDYVERAFIIGTYMCDAKEITQSKISKTTPKTKKLLNIPKSEGIKYKI